MKKLIPILLLFIVSCTKIDIQPNPVIDLGKTSASTAIVKVMHMNNTLIVDYAVTTGSKYSAQIVPFGGNKPVIVGGFTAEADLVTKKYDLSSLKPMNYDLIFIDITGKETKFPVLIK
jgi:hypothetical protein